MAWRSVVMRTMMLMVAAAAGVVVAGPAPATFLVTLEQAGVQNSTSTFTTSGVESFNAVATTGSGTTGFASTFGNSGVSGTYAGVGIMKADQYGGAGGAGNYAVALNGGTTASYSLANLAIAGGQSVNYFGLWISALDAGNTLSFFRNGTQVYSFGASDLIAAINASANPSAYYANPNAAFAGQNKAEPYAFANFYDQDGGFDKVVLTETRSGAGYESDNHTVGHYTATSGSTVGAVPEPATWGTMLVGFGLLGAAMRRRRRVAADLA